MVGLDQFVRFLFSHLGFLRIVLVNDLDRPAGHLPAQVLKAEIEPVAHIIPDRRGRAAESSDETDFNAVGSSGRRRRNARSRETHNQVLHFSYSSPRYISDRRSASAPLSKFICKQ